MAINLNNPYNKVKVLDEATTRKKMINFARQNGFEHDLLKIFNKYDNLLRNCTDEKERKDIGKLGALEVYNLLNRTGDLYVDGQLIAKETKF